MAHINNSSSAFATLFDPSSPSGSSTSYLSFSSLADLENNNKTQRWNMEYHPVNMEQTDFSDLIFGNTSPLTYSSDQTDNGQSPWALSPVSSYASGKGSVTNLSLPPSTFSDNVLFPELSLLDDTYDYIPPTLARNPLLANKASFESIASSSGTSEHLITPRQSMNNMVHAWDDMATLTGSTSYGYTEVVKEQRSQSSGSIWSAGSLVEDGTFARMQAGQEAVVSFDTNIFTPPAPSFVGQNLDWVFDQHQEVVVEKKKAEGQLLPAACIVGNVHGWQSSSPTYPSFLDFENAAAMENVAEFRTEPFLSVPSIPTRPASTTPVPSSSSKASTMMRK